MLALRDYLVALAPVQQTTRPCKHTLLSLRTTFLGEAVMLIARESAREVLAHIAIRHFLRTVHQHLSTIIELWNAIHRQQQGEGLFQGQRVLAVT